jgi:hypothetical protein
MNFRPLFYFIFIFFLSACTSLPPKNVEEKITARVEKRWDALIGHNWTDAYQYETVGYRESHTLEQFKAKFGQAVSWQKIKVLKVQLNESKSNATVLISVPFQIMLPGQGLQQSAANLTEIWLLDDGEWWNYTK